MKKKRFTAYRSIEPGQVDDLGNPDEGRQFDTFQEALADLSPDGIAQYGKSDEGYYWVKSFLDRDISFYCIVENEDVPKPAKLYIRMNDGYSITLRFDDEAQAIELHDRITQLMTSGGVMKYSNYGDMKPFTIRGSEITLVKIIEIE